MNQKWTVPTELLLQILTLLHLDYDRRSLRNVSLCSHALQTIAEPLLYDRFSVVLNRHQASNSYSALRNRAAPYVKSMHISILWENTRSPEFEAPPMELLHHLQRLKITLSSDFPSTSNYHDRIWDLISRIPPNTLISFHCYSLYISNGYLFTELCNSLRTQLELQELAVSPRRNHKDFSTIVDTLPISASLPSFRIFSAPTVRRPPEVVPHFGYIALHPFIPCAYFSLKCEVGNISALLAYHINLVQLWNLVDITKLFPNVETLGVLTFESDNRRRILGQPLWNWLKTLTRLRAISVLIDQPEVRAVRTLEEVLRKSPPWIHKIRVVTLYKEVSQLREYEKGSDASDFEVTFDLICPIEQQYPPTPNYWDFCFFKADIYDGHFL